MTAARVSGWKKDERKDRGRTEAGPGGKSRKLLENEISGVDERFDLAHHG